MFRAHDLGDLSEDGAAAQVDEPIGDASEGRIRGEPGGVVGAAAFQGEHELRHVTPLAGLPGKRVAERLRDGRPPRRGPDGAPFRLDGDDVDRLAVLARGVGEGLGDDLLASEREDHDGADVRMTAVRRQRLVSEMHVRPELAAAGEVRQRGAVRRRGRRHPLRDERGADDRGDHEHVVARADPAIRAPVAVETWSIVHQCGRGD